MRYLPAILLLLLSFVLTATTCKGPLELEQTTLLARVVAKESCQGIDSLESIVLDFSVNGQTQQVGDSLTIDGIFYSNLVKIMHLDPALRETGTLLELDFYIDPYDGRQTSYGCDAVATGSYQLKEIMWSKAEKR